MRTILKIIDSVNEWIGEKLKFVVLFLIVVVCSEVMMRYIFNEPTSQLPVIQTWTGTLLYSFAFGYVLLHKGHVRVDVLYSRFSDRVKAIVDVVLWFLFFLPAIGYLTYVSYKWAVYAITTGEKSMMTYWYPPLGPVRTILFVGLLLFLLQGIAMVVRDAYFAVRSQPYD